MKNLSGVYTALATPFRDGVVDLASLRKLVRFQLDNGIDGLVVSGTTAESPCLTAAEKKQVFDAVKSEAAGAVPIVLGTGTNNTAEAVEWTKDAEKWGADAALVVVPYYNKPPQRGLFQHFQKVAETTSLPVLLYNVPGRTITKLELETIVELSRLPNIVGIKEATGDIEFGARIARECGKDFLVTSGDDATYLDLIGVGGQGVISVASHILPKEFVEWCKRARSGDKSAREELQGKLDLINYLYVESNPIPVKMALYLMGIFASPELRLPLVTMSEPFAQELKRKMAAAGML